MKAARTVALTFLGIMALVAIAPDLWSPADYATQFRESAGAAPSHRFPLGTDALGRDRLSRLIYGKRGSLVLAPSAALLSCVAAALLGGIAALAGGVIESMILAAADLFL